MARSAIHQIESTQGPEIGGNSTEGGEGGAFFGRFNVVGLEALEVLEEAAAQAVESAL